jgi:hypothetical protein
MLEKRIQKFKDLSFENKKEKLITILSQIKDND